MRAVHGFAIVWELQPQSNLRGAGDRARNKQQLVLEKQNPVMVTYITIPRKNGDQTVARVEISPRALEHSF
jgi:hypothetical protein